MNGVIVLIVNLIICFVFPSVTPRRPLKVPHKSSHGHSIVGDAYNYLQ